MNPISSWREVLDICSDLQELDDVSDFAGNIGYSKGLEFLIDFGFKRSLIDHTAVFGEERAFCIEQLSGRKKVFAEQRFVDVLPVIPRGPRLRRRGRCVLHVHPPLSVAQFVLEGFPENRISPYLP